MQGRDGPSFVAASTRRLRPVTATGVPSAATPTNEIRQELPGGIERSGTSTGCRRRGRICPSRRRRQGGFWPLDPALRAPEPISSLGRPELDAATQRLGLLERDRLAPEQGVHRVLQVARLHLVGMVRVVVDRAVI